LRALRLAHRGDSRAAPENTIGALLAALSVAGCDGLEFDVRASSDGVPVLLHDDDLWRVQRVDARSASLTAEEAEAQGIPTLAAALGAIGRSAFLDVELKESVPGVVPVLEAARGNADTLDRAVVSSFDPRVLAEIGEQRRAWKLWLNSEDMNPSTLRRARDLGCSAVSAEWHAVDEQSVARANEHGLEVAAWTVRRRSTYGRLERLGAVAICVEGAALDG
jgi:glycerophosphoryl diester phosphodiesterase